MESLPHLKGINKPITLPPNDNVMGIIIRCSNDDNMHKVNSLGIRPSSMGSGPLSKRIYKGLLNSITKSARTTVMLICSLVSPIATCSKQWEN